MTVQFQRRARNTVDADGQIQDHILEAQVRYRPANTSMLVDGILHCWPKNGTVVFIGF